jgi:hypothetical protein
VDPNDTDTSYIVKASVVVTAESLQRSDVSMAASQQAVLHREISHWFKPNEYQEVVRSEDTIDDPEFYTRFFDALQKQLKVVSEEQSRASSDQ